MKKSIAIILGTRPEAIKLVPVYLSLKVSEKLNPILVSTGQHKEMLNQIFSFFNIKPDIELSLMTGNQTLSVLTSKLFFEVDQLLSKNPVDGIVVQGDTTTAMVSAMVGYYNKTKVVHVEAGLRTYNKFSPFPEEINRRIIGMVSDVNFAPTASALQTLESEKTGGVHLVGNTVIDSLLVALDRVNQKKDYYFLLFKELFERKHKIILVTGHRRESFGEGFEQICGAILTLAQTYKELEFVYPVHLNPNVKGVVHRELGKIRNIHLLDPLPYDQLVFLMSKSYLILTDSGGIQEEAPSLSVPLLVMRETTERPEGIEAGCAVLTGTKKEDIVNCFQEIYHNEVMYAKMSQVKSPYGDGKSAERIKTILEEYISNDVQK